MKINLVNCLIFVLITLTTACQNNEQVKDGLAETELATDTLKEIELDTFPQLHFFEKIVFYDYWLEKDSVYKKEVIYDSAYFELLSDSSVIYEYFPQGKRKSSIKSIDTLVFSTVYDEISKSHLILSRFSGNRQETFSLKEKELTLLSSIWWLCPDLFCESKHGHMQKNTTQYIDKQLGIICWFSQTQENFVTVLSSINGKKINPEILTVILSRYQMDQRILKAISE